MTTPLLIAWGCAGASLLMAIYSCGIAYETKKEADAIRDKRLMLEAAARELDELIVVIAQAGAGLPKTETRVH